MRFRIDKLVEYKSTEVTRIGDDERARFLCKADFLNLVADNALAILTFFNRITALER